MRIWHRGLTSLLLSTVLLYAGVAFANGASVSDLSQEIERIPQLAYESPAEADAIIKRVRRSLDLLTQESKERFFLFEAYFYGVSQKQQKRLELLLSYDWSGSQPKYQARAYQQIVEAHVNLNQFDHALDNLDLAIHLLPLLQEDMAKMLILHSAYTVFSTLYRYDQALKFADRITALGREGNSKRIQCYGMTNRLDALFLDGQFERVLLEADDAIALCLSSQDQLSADLIRVYQLVASMQVYGGALYEEQAEALYAQLKENQQEYTIFLEHALGAHYFYQGHIEKAGEFYLRAFNRADELDLLRLKPKLAEAVAKVKWRQQRWDEYAAFINLTIDAHKAYEQDLYDKSVYFHLAKINAEDIEGQLKIIEAKNRELQLQNQLAETRFKHIRILFAWASIGCLALFALVVFVQRQKAKIKISLETDTLTKVLSRVSLMESCTKAVTEAKRREQPLSLVVFDLDHFKKINDTFGHAVGDWVLKTVSRVVRNSIRDKDILGRLGGEEFVICLPNTDIEQARQLSERCREGLERIIAPVANNKLDISASFGVAKLDETVDSLDKLLVTADKCLYQAKHLGRNRVATVLDDGCTEAYKPSMGLCSLQAEHGRTPLK